MSISIARLGQGTGEESELVQINLSVSDSDWLGTFDQIEVQRSKGESTGPYESLTAGTWSGARLPAYGQDAPSTPVTGARIDAVGRDLQLRLNELEDFTVVFTDPGAGTLTLSEAAGQIQAQLAARVRSWVDGEGVLVLETTQPGTGAALRILGGDAVPVLGLSSVEPESIAYGKDGYISLVVGRESYSFLDLQGSSTYFYRTRFRSSTYNTASAYTQPSSAAQPIGVNSTSLVTGRVTLVGIDGRPLPGVLVRIFSKQTPKVVDGMLVAGTTLDGLTDDSGSLEFNLVRGLEVTVTVDGTEIVRDVTVPIDATIGVFNLFDPNLGPNDYWTVAVPQLVYAPRRSL